MALRPLLPLLPLLLAAVRLKCARVAPLVGCAGREPTTSAPCKGRAQLPRLIRVIGDIETSHDKRILLPPAVFDKFKGKPLYTCILRKILEFYENVLERKGREFPDLLHLIATMKKCVSLDPGQRRCKKLYREAKRKPINEAVKDSSLMARDIAQLQIQKLLEATKQLDDVETQKKAISELKSLEFYLPEDKRRSTRRSSWA